MTTHTPPLSIVGLRKDDALAISGDVDQGVATPATTAQEVAADIVNLGRYEAEQHFQAAGSALPHATDGTPTPATLPAQAMGEKTTERGAELEAVQRDAMRFAWIAKHFTHIGGVYVKDHEVKTFAFRCDDDAPMGDEADADRLRAMVDAAAPQKGDAS